MTATSRIRSTLRWLGLGIGAAGATYGALAALSWARYGRAPEAAGEDRDELLDRFIPTYDIVERHHIRVQAPAATTLAAAREQDLMALPAIRAIFRARELALGSKPDDRPQPRGLLAAMLALGWGILAEIPDREIVVGSVTQPWEPNVVFRALPASEFAAFSAPGFVKIVWTLAVRPLDDGASIFRTETRAVATDATARTRFRRYWAFVSPGIAMIRRLSLRPLKRAAEQRARTARTHQGVPAW